jgi:hypothetical protein
VRFRLFPLRFHFVVRRAIRFPAAGAANLLRGVLGSALHDLDAAAYARFFAPANQEGPSGLADPPRPFVLRTAHLDRRALETGETFHFDFHLFDMREPWVPLLRKAFGTLRGAELTGISGEERPLVLSLDPLPHPVALARVEFLTPTELKTHSGLASTPEFAVLATRIRDRISTLRQLYGDGPLPIDFAAFGARAAAVRMTECRVHPVAARRTSRATGQTHPLGGFVGEACYQGALEEFLPYLLAAQWTGVGRQTSWGKGALSVHADEGAVM